MLNYDDKGSAFFAVFDGHGGDEVSKYCSLHFPPFIKRSLYQDQNIPEAIKKSFLEFDRSLKEPHVINELRKLASLDDLEEIEEDEASLLKKEANMPLDQLVQHDEISDNLSDPKNGESSKDIKNNDIAETSENKAESNDKPDEKNGSNGKSGENSNHTEESKDNDEAALDKPSSSGTSKYVRAAKSQVLKALNKQIYEAFLNDFESDDDDEEDDEEASEEGDDSGDDDEDEEEDEEVDSDDGEAEMPADPFANAYITPGGGSGCTAIVAIVRGNTIYVANVGTSIDSTININV